MTSPPNEGIIEVFLTDGSSSSFYVTAFQTTNALKYIISKRLKLDQTLWVNFGLFVLVNDKKIMPLNHEHPLALHLSWGDDSGTKFKFLFKPNTSSKEKVIDSRSVAWTGNENVNIIKRNFPWKPKIYVPKRSNSFSHSNPKRLSGAEVKIKDVYTIIPTTPTPNTILPHQQQQQQPQPQPQPLPQSQQPPEEKPKSGLSVSANSYGEDTLESYETLENFVPQNFRLSMIRAMQEQPVDKTPDKRLQEHQDTLVKWVNSKLPAETTKIENLSADFKSGVILCRLIENLTGKPLPKAWHKTPKNILHQLDNVSIVLDLLSDYGINLVGVNSEDICGTNNENLIILILVALIKKFQSRKNLTSSITSLITTQESSTFKKFHMKGEIIPIIDESEDTTPIQDQSEGITTNQDSKGDNSSAKDSKGDITSTQDSKGDISSAKDNNKGDTTSVQDKKEDTTPIKDKEIIPSSKDNKGETTSAQDKKGDPTPAQDNKGDTRSTDKKGDPTPAQDNKGDTRSTDKKGVIIPKDETPDYFSNYDVHIDVTLPTLVISQILFYRITGMTPFVTELSPSVIKKREANRPFSLYEGEKVITKPRGGSLSELQYVGRTEHTSKWDPKLKYSASQGDSPKFGGRSSNKNREKKFLLGKVRKFSSTKEDLEKEGEMDKQNDLSKIDLTFTLPGLIPQNTENQQTTIIQTCRQLIGELDNLLPNIEL